MTGRIEITPGTQITSLIGQADAAFERNDVRGIDTAYRQAVALADSDELRSALAVDHVVRLLTRGGATLALRRCGEYLAAAAVDEFDLWLLRAEARGAIGDHEGAATDATMARVVSAKCPEPLSDDDNARLLRVEGLAAADRGDLTRAKQWLSDARRCFLAVTALDRAAVIDEDLSLLDVRLGKREAVAEALARPQLKTTADHLRVATALKRELRYEEAYRILLRAVAAPDLDPALRVPVLSQLVVLARLTCQHETAERLTKMLRDVAAEFQDPSTDEAMARLSPEEWLGPVTSLRFNQAVQDARRLIGTARLDDVERLLVDLRPRAENDRDKATWHLATGELELARHRISGTPSALRTAIGHLGRAADLAEDPALIEIRIPALRRLGRAYARRADGSQPAAWCWGEAHRLEEHVAACQITDDVRIGMLLAAPDEHDERISAASEAKAAYGAEAAAGIVVAMEAARGATILGGILPNGTDLIRDLPQLGDLDGAWRWVRGIARSLPPSQVVWLLHATPDHVHHAIIGRELLHHLCVPLSPTPLEAAVNDLSNCQDREFLEATVASGEFDQALAEITDLIAVRAVVPLIPPEVQRVATVAGGTLAEIPFAALAVPGTSARLGHRYAFSDLPCLSARSPLYRRSLYQRGDRALLVSPPGDGLTASARMRGQTLLDGSAATPEQLRAHLESRRYNRVRIDSHGRYDARDPARSWLQLEPAGSCGRLRPEALQSMDLRGCGTLVLGACESGMAHRRGRDERAGFVRAAIQAGAGAVVAARWVADDPVAAPVLDRFERYLRYLPRDVALQRAQLDVCEGKAGQPDDVPYRDHPARWACWTLYGDSGWQAGGGPFGRLIRRRLNQRRRRD
ncbi:MAG: CHAT domain-containing protein [Streptosporangiaceae bacterium]|nr:CHAT domain-containing protein [Streptosporangiaceae bacterium]